MSAVGTWRNRRVGGCPSRAAAGRVRLPGTGTGVGGWLAGWMGEGRAESSCPAGTRGRWRRPGLALSCLALPGKREAILRRRGKQKKEGAPLAAGSALGLQGGGGGRARQGAWTGFGRSSKWVGGLPDLGSGRRQVGGARRSIEGSQVSVCAARGVCVCVSRIEPPVQGTGRGFHAHVDAEDLMPKLLAGGGGGC